MGQMWKAWRDALDTAERGMDGLWASGILTKPIPVYNLGIVDQPGKPSRPSASQGGHPGSQGPKTGLEG